MSVLKRQLDELVSSMCGCVPATLLLSGTRRTDAETSRVRGVVRVALRAVRFRRHVRSAIRAPFGSRDSYVLGGGDELHVLGVDAPLGLTPMVDRESVWYGAPKPLVIDAVHPPPVTLPEAHAPVAVLMHGTVPKPAPIVCNRVSVVTCSQAAVVVVNKSQRLSFDRSLGDARFLRQLRFLSTPTLA